MSRRGVILARQSRTRERSESREGQVEHAQTTADRFDVEVVATLIEPPSTSGSKDGGLTRRDFQRLVAMIRQRQADCVVVYKTDRLTRGGMRGWAPLLDAANDAGIDIDHLVLTPDGWKSEFELGIRASMDREEAKKLSDRSKDMHDRLARTGRFSGGTRAFGFEADGVTHRADEADAIREAARRRLDGDSWHDIALDFQARGIVGATGKAMRPEAIARHCTSLRTAGQRRHGDRTIRAAWQPILDDPTWRALQPKPNGQRWVRRHLLSGFLYCGNGDCGARLGIGRTSAGAVRYACPPKVKGGCGSLTASAAPLEELVVRLLLRRVDRPEVVDAINAHSRRTPRDEALDDDIAADLAALDELVHDRYVARIMAPGDYVAQVQVLEARIAANRRRRSRVQVEQAGAQWGGRGGALAAAWTEMGLEARRTVLAAYLDRVVIGPAVRGLNVFDERRILPAHGGDVVWREL